MVSQKEAEQLTKGEYHRMTQVELNAMETTEPKNIEIKRLGGKDVYLFEDHATALGAWSDYRRKNSNSPNLITLDCHTDTHTAFTGFIYYRSGEATLPRNIDEQSEALCREIDYRESNNVNAVISKLRNDEHIDAAIKARVINAAFVISYFGYNDFKSIEESEHRKRVETTFENNVLTVTHPEPFDLPTDALNYIAPKDRIFVLPVEAGFDPEVALPGATEEEQQRRHCDLAIEKSYLDEKLKIAQQMALSIDIADLLAEDYVLDIDLDYFRTATAMKPSDPSTFYELIRNASAITVALEPKFVLYERLDGESITSEILLPQLIKHFENAFE